jgi:hypothetical protein
VGHRWARLAALALVHWARSLLCMTTKGCVGLVGLAQHQLPPQSGELQADQTLMREHGRLAPERAEACKLSLFIHRRIKYQSSG